MNKMKVIVYDDMPQISQQIADKVQKASAQVDVVVASTEDFEDTVGELNRRRSTWRVSGMGADTGTRCMADEADVLIVDYDLLGYSTTADITGNRLAYLLRSFSDCGLVIVLNEYGHNAFDLTLRVPVESFADLHLGDIQIGNPGLWGEHFRGYRPWQWPIIPSACVSFDQCVDDVNNNLDQPVLEFLGLAPYIDWLPKRFRNLFGGSETIEDVTFESFVSRSRGGLEVKDVVPPEHSARIAAARLMALLNGVLLPQQSLLVDAPHLAMRFPSLVCADAVDIEAWNKLCDLSGVAIDEILSDVLAPCRYERSHWLWRPVWYWPAISTNEAIPEVNDPWSRTAVDLAFCENISRFVPSELADGFRADVLPPFDKRYVLRRRSDEGREYLGSGQLDSSLDPCTVNYEPQSALSL